MNRHIQKLFFFQMCALLQIHLKPHHPAKRLILPQFLAVCIGNSEIILGLNVEDT